MRTGSRLPRVVVVMVASGSSFSSDLQRLGILLRRPIQVKHDGRGVDICLENPLFNTQPKKPRNTSHNVTGKRAQGTSHNEINVNSASARVASSFFCNNKLSLDWIQNNKNPHSYYAARGNQ